jgi:hypothetical protein
MPLAPIFTASICGGWLDYPRRIDPITSPTLSPRRSGWLVHTLHAKREPGRSFEWISA